MLAFMADVASYGTRGDQSGFNQIDVSTEELNQRYRELEEERRSLESKIHEMEQAGILKMTAVQQRATEGPRKEREAVLRAELRKHLSAEAWNTYQS